MLLGIAAQHHRPAPRSHHSDDPEAEMKCERAIAAAVAAGPHSFEAHASAAQLRACQNRAEDAKFHIKSAIESFDKHLVEYQEAVSTGALVSAHRHAEAVVLPLPSWELRFGLAKLGMELELYEESVHLLQQLIAEEDTHLEAWFLQAEAAYLLRDFAESLELCDTALAMVEKQLEGAIGKTKKELQAAQRQFTAMRTAAATAAAEAPAADMEEDMGGDSEDDME